MTWIVLLAEKREFVKFFLIVLAMCVMCAQCTQFYL
jgi:hypothetical protein